MELKEILGEDLYNQVEEQLKGKGPQGKDITLVATNTGDYVPAEKYETLKNEYTKKEVEFSNLTESYNKLSASKEKDIKTILLNNELAKANLVKVNGNYDYIRGMMDIDKFTIENNELVDGENLIGKFVTDNPYLVKSVEPAKKDNPATPAVPANNGVNPPNPQGAVKDRAFYEDAYKKATTLEERMSIKREAGENKIML